MNTSNSVRVLHWITFGNFAQLWSMSMDLNTPRAHSRRFAETTSQGIPTWISWDDRLNRLYALGVEELSYCLGRTIHRSCSPTYSCAGGSCGIQYLDMACILRHCGVFK
ncbi:hypothetical protein LINPERPRIM_LOCUS1583 [Linum perenne]